MAETPASAADAGDVGAELARVLDPAYGTALRLTGNAADAEDLVQDAALLAFRGYSGFRPGSNFRAWFFRILLNRFYSDYRKRRRSGTAIEVEAAPEGYLFERAKAAGLLNDPDPGVALLSRLDTETIEAALQALADDFRAAATLYFLEDLSYQEIADVLDVPVGTVRSRLHRARRILKESLWQMAEERGIVASGRKEE